MIKQWIQQWRLSNDMNARQQPPACSSENRAFCTSHEALAKAPPLNVAPADLHDDIMRAVQQTDAPETDTASSSSSMLAPAFGFAVVAILIVSLIVTISNWGPPTAAGDKPMMTQSPDSSENSAFQSLTTKPGNVANTARQRPSTLTRIDRSVAAAYTAELKSLVRDLASAEAFLRRRMDALAPPGDSG